MTRIFATSDLHFGHAGIIRYCARPFAGVAAMDERLVDLWNETVRPQDTVWVLGDVALGDLGASLGLVGLLAGHKILVPGNHDRCWLGERSFLKGSADDVARRLAAARTRYLDAGFAEIADDPAPIAVGPATAKLSHFPYVGDSTEVDRHVEHRPADEGGWLLHGHVHERWRQRGRMINVGVDAWAGRPVPLETLAGLIEAGEHDLERLPWYD